MRKLPHIFGVVALVLTLVGCSHEQAAPPASAGTFRVMSYNIHHAEGSDRRVDIPRIAKVITDNRADLVAVQEVDVRTKRVPADEAAELARLTGMHVAFAKAIDYQGGDYGQVILSRFPISDPRTYKLPSKADKEQRVALAVTVSPGDGRPDFRFVGTHLDHQSDADRMVQVVELLRDLNDESRAGMPTILAGDFNAVPQSGPVRALLGQFVNVTGEQPTIPADHPKSKIDYVLTSAGSPWAAAGPAWVVDEPVASDHRPVVVELRWKP